MKIKTYHTIKTVPKSNREIVETVKIGTSHTHIQDSSLTWLYRVTSIKRHNESTVNFEPKSNCLLYSSDGILFSTFLRSSDKTKIVDVITY